jgi:hypothetical protein
MGHIWRMLVLLAALAAGVRAVAFSEEPKEDPQTVLEQNRQRLEKLHADPEHFARLRRDYQSFKALPPERQAQLRQLDHEFHAEDSATQARLWAVLERYVAWLEKLPEGDRAWIESAPDRATRLERVKYLRDQQWVKRLPEKTQEELSKLTDDKQRADRIAELRQEERQRRLDWFWSSHPRNEASLRQARPTRLNEFPPEVRAYYFAGLAHVLPQAEKDRLRGAEGNWPLYARLLAKTVTETPPPELPGFAGDSKPWPTKFVDLPNDWKQALSPFRPEKRDAVVQKKGELQAKAKEWRALLRHAGKWPDYAIDVTQFARAKKLNLKTQLGPSKLDQFPMVVQNFVENQLLPRLAKDEKDNLRSREGKWPEYPEELYRLAKKHGVALPGTHRPCPADFWEAASKLLPDVPDRELRRFALNDLSADERGQLNLSPDDAGSRDRLMQIYWDRHPQELERLLKPRRKK